MSIEQYHKMGYQIAHSIQAFDEAHWDAVAGNGLVLCHRWQRVMEASRRDYQPLYLLVEDDLGPMAAIVTRRADRFGQLSWHADLLRRLTMVIGPSYSTNQGGIALRRGVTLSDALPNIEGILGTVCRSQGQLLLGVSNVWEDDLPIWKACGYTADLRPPTMVLDLPVESYEAYLQSLSAKARSDLRRFRRRGEEMGVAFSVGAPGNDTQQLYELFGEVFARHGEMADTIPFTAAFFPAIEREMGSDAILFRGYAKGQLAGFALLLKHGETLEWPATGLRYDLAHPSYLYFLLIDEAVRWAIAHGYRRINGGITNEQEKMRHGFRPKVRWFCYRLSPRPLNRLLTLATGLGRRLRREPSVMAGERL